MAEITETVTTGKTTTTKWWFTLLTPQTVVVIFAGFASLVLFWNRQKDHGNHLEKIDQALQELIEKRLPVKADVSDLQSVEGRVTRQYETMVRMNDRIVELEKETAYQKGFHDGQKEKETK